MESGGGGQEKGERRKGESKTQGEGKLQFADNGSTICDSHAQEDCNGPVPQFAGDHEDGDLGFIFACQMELEEEGGHAEKTGY